MVQVIGTAFFFILHSRSFVLLSVPFPFSMGHGASISGQGRQRRLYAQFGQSGVWTSRRVFSTEECSQYSMTEPYDSAFP